MRIGRPARKHGITDEDIIHAVRNAIRERYLGDNLTMLIGAAVDGTFLEIGVLDIDGADPVAIHAMKLRPKFRYLLV